tara:strand:+ start:5252 stop:5428 length:177 start_codon:yes stop_codon:yes gene_type:complete
MKYNNIKKILRLQTEKGVKTLWTFNKQDQEFTQIYQNYSDGLRIFTPLQLLEKLTKEY